MNGPTLFSVFIARHRSTWKADSLRINFDSQHTTFSKSNADWFLSSSMPVAGFRPFLSQGDLARRRQIAQP